MAKTWLWNMAVLVAGTPIEHDQDNQPVGGGPQARVVSGTLPSLDEIAKLPGKIRIGQQSAGVARKYRETELVKVDEE